MKEDWGISLSEFKEELFKEDIIDVPEILPLMAIKDIVLFPSTVHPLFVGRPKSLKAIQEALKKDNFIVLTTQKNSHIENPSPKNLYKIGTVAFILKTINL